VIVAGLMEGRWREGADKSKWWMNGWADESLTVLRVYNEEHRSAASFDRVIT